MSQPDRRDRPPDSLAEAALWWADRGFAVFPLEERGKKPRRPDVVRLVGELPSSNGNGHVRGGFHQATRSPEVLGRWWRKWPTANLGGAVPAGTVVLDLDGDDAERCLEVLGYAVPESFSVRTHRGRHVYFQLPAGLELQQTTLAAALRVRSTQRCKQPEGAGAVELRTAGKGYVVLPPSVHPSGARYELLAGSPQELAPAPAWLLNAFRVGNAPRAGEGTRARSTPASISLPVLAVGERDQGLFRYACRLRALHLGRDEAECLLRNAWERVEQPAGDPYPWERARRKLESAWRYPPSRAESAPTPTAELGERPSEGDSVNSVNSVLRGEIQDFYTNPARMAPSFKELVPFRTAAAVPEFPLDHLPLELRSIVEEVAASIQVPADLPALLSLGVVAAACTYTGLWVSLSGLPPSPVALYLAPVLKPSERKSTTFKLLVDPLRGYERSLRRQQAPQILAAKESFAAGQGVLANLRRQIRECEDAAKRSALVARIAEEAGKLAAPPPEVSLIAGDATPEGLAVRLHEQGGRLAVFDTEGSLLSNVLGRYTSGSTNFDLLLRAWSGDELRVDRKGSPPLSVASPVLTVCLTLQPEMLRRLGEHRESITQGLASRFLYAIPASKVGTRLFRGDSISEAAKKLYEAALLRLLHLGPPPQDLGHGAPLRCVKASQEAMLLWIAFHDATEVELSPRGRLAAIADWGGKLPGNVARIAAALHAIQHHRETCDHPIEAPTMAAAVAIGSYFKVHALAAYEVLGADPEAALILRALEVLAASGWETFSERDLYRPLGAKPEAIRPVLSVLDARGYVARLPTPLRPPPRRVPGGGVGQVPTSLAELTELTESAG